MTDVSPNTAAPTLWNYDVCGQYPGAVPAGATVSLPCRCNMAAHRYLVLQFPINSVANFCELEVFVRGEYIVSPVKLLQPMRRMSKICRNKYWQMKIMRRIHF